MQSHSGSSQVTAWQTGHATVDDPASVIRILLLEAVIRLRQLQLTLRTEVLRMLRNEAVNDAPFGIFCFIDCMLNLAPCSDVAILRRLDSARVAFEPIEVSALECHRHTNLDGCSLADARREASIPEWSSDRIRVE